jgi:hypothetical protein
MLFFQVLLLGGYAYAHLIVSRLSGRVQVLVHVGLIVLALLALPITPEADWKPEGIGNPIIQILILALVCVGLPYFVLSATGPLLQGWFTRANPGTPPYRLYAFSNAGSLIALVSYPFIVEPALSRHAQAQVWSVGLFVFGALCTCCAIWVWRKPAWVKHPEVAETGDVGMPRLPALGTRLLWLALPAAASVELLAVTNKICQDITVIPLLWVLPLSLYLLSFIICFHSERWYVRPVFLIALLLAIGGVGYAWMYEDDLLAWQLISIYSAFLLVCCIVCHGELFRLRPHPRHLTRYYLMIAAGGAAGGFFVAVIAPLIFNAYRELQFGILACVLFVLLADKSSAFGRSRRRLVWIGVILVAGAAAILVQSQRSRVYEVEVLSTRNFFGVLTVWEDERDDPAGHQYVLQHGTTLHGLQFVDQAKHLLPTAYYGRSSGAGLAIANFPREVKRRIGAVGLGVGTIAAYGKEGDYFRFYEINPEVKRLAETQFTYLANCAAEVDVIIGDARLSMENEAGQEFDVLILDAFSSAAVPVHLLTKEAFEIYLTHIKPDGVIAVHTSNLHIDLDLVVWKAAEHFKLKSAWIESSESGKKGTLASDWILLTSNEEFLRQRAILRKASEPEGDFSRLDLWTDERVNLFQVLK